MKRRSIPHRSWEIGATFEGASNRLHEVALTTAKRRHKDHPLGTSIQGLTHHLLGFTAQKQQTDALGPALAQLTHQADAIALLKVFGDKHQIRSLRRMG